MTTKSVKDYYEMFGIPQTATQEEIRLAYRKMARAYHPDISTEPNAEERFKELNEAYAILIDPEKRKVYDALTIQNSASPPSPSPKSTQTPPQTNPYASPATTHTPPPSTTKPVASQPQAQKRPKRLYPPTWAILLIMLGVCIIAGVGIAVAREFLPRLTSRPSGGAEAVNVGKLSTFDSPPTIPTDYTAVQEGGTPLLTVLPHQLIVADTSFSVVPVTPEQGRWPIPEKQQDVAVWVYGTVVNYVLGIPFTQTTESLLAKLASDARITLALDNGNTLVFGAPQSQRIAADDLTPMSQQQPGLTLVLLGSDQADRLIVRARYLPEESYSAEGKQRVEGLIVEVLKSGVVQDTGDTRHFVVEYRITNESNAVVNPNFFDMTLENDAGQRYPVNAETSAEGEYGALQNPIEIGASVLGSAGYLIPRDIRPPITWIFRADPSSTKVIRNILPYEVPLPKPAQPAVELSSAFADGVRNSVVINGVIRNTGETALTVTLDDISLTSGAGDSSLQASTPLLPWTIAGGERQDFEVQFSRPNGASSVLLDILGFTFQIEGLP